MKKSVSFTFLLAIILFTTSCATLNKSMKEPNSIVEFEKDDFTLSSQVTGEATQTLIFGIDFARLFNSESANIASSSPFLPSFSSIPVIGSSTIFPAKSTESLALYNLMVSNPGYDVIFYPQYEVSEQRPIGFRIVRIRNVKVTARLGKLN